MTMDYWLDLIATVTIIGWPFLVWMAVALRP